MFYIRDVFAYKLRHDIIDFDKAWSEVVVWSNSDDSCFYESASLNIGGFV